VPFTAAGWVFENKLDGVRALARKTGRQERKKQKASLREDLAFL
jgi:ATP-dependent DNA ligase